MGLFINSVCGVPEGHRDALFETGSCFCVLSFEDMNMAPAYFERAGRVCVKRFLRRRGIRCFAWFCDTFIAVKSAFISNLSNIL